MKREQARKNKTCSQNVRENKPTPEDPYRVVARDKSGKGGVGWTPAEEAGG